MLDKGILIQREHVESFETTDFHFPVIFLAEIEARIIKIHGAIHIGQRLYREARELTVTHLTHPIKTNQDTTVHIPCSNGVIFIKFAQRAAAAFAIHIEFNVTVDFKIAIATQNKVRCGRIFPGFFSSRFTVHRRIALNSFNFFNFSGLLYLQILDFLLSPIGPIFCCFQTGF